MKANGQKRLLICDSHDSHISAQFVRFCRDHDIILFLLLSHSSHLFQSLDVGIFSSLKYAMSLQLNRLYATEISRLQKAEWLEHYAKARLKAMTSTNIKSDWRGARLFPMNVNRILHLLLNSSVSLSSSLAPCQNNTMPTSLLITSSPPDGIVLRRMNPAFKDALMNADLASPLQNHARRLSGVAEHLHAENSILRHENMELKQLINKRKERMSEKRLILKGKVIVSTEEICQKLAMAEQMTKEWKNKRCKTRHHSSSTNVVRDEEDIQDNNDEEEEEIGECIEVQF